jgi:hypothetical protein
VRAPETENLPLGQASHASTRLLTLRDVLTRPAGHLRHEPTASNSEYSPGAHTSQTKLWPPGANFLNRPARHRHAEYTLPATDVLFAGHGVQLTEPWAECVPGGHGVQALAPGALKVPAGQSRHTSVVAFSTGENFPATQASQVPGRPSWIVESKVPGPQGVHAEAPESEKNPAPQGRHDEDPFTEKLPWPHVAQKSEPADENVPPPHGWQPLALASPSTPDRVPAGHDEQLASLLDLSLYCPCGQAVQPSTAPA